MVSIEVLKRIELEERDARYRLYSGVTAAILLSLYGKCMTVPQLVERLRDVYGIIVTSHVVRTYLQRLASKGMIVNHSPYWCLTEYGREYVMCRREWLLDTIEVYKMIRS